MALPEYVKKLAMDAIAGKETTEWIRAHASEKPADALARNTKSENSEQAGKLATEVVSQNETMQQIRLVSVNEIDAPLPTPNRRLSLLSGRARMESLWQGYGAAAEEDALERDDGR